MAGDSFRDLRSVVQETATGRAEAIARTEVGTASNLASADRYAAGGIQQVELLDGPGCHWGPVHQPGPRANVRIVTISD